MNIEIRGANQNESEKILEQVVLSFNFPSSLFLPQFQLHPGRKPEHTRLAIINDVLAASVQIFTKKIYLRGVPVSLGAIANVGTLPEYRHRGINEKLFKDVIQFIKNQGMEMSGLYTGVHDVYRPHGYEIWPQKDTFIDTSNIDTAVKIKSPQLRIVPIEKKDQTKVFRLYDQKALRYTGPVCRDKSYWEKSLQWNILRDFIFLGAFDQKGTLLAYLRAGYSKDRTQSWIREAWGNQDDPKVWDTLLLSVLKEFRQQGCNGKIRMPGCFTHHPLTEAFRRMGGLVSYRNNNGQMLRLLKPSMIFTKLLQGKPAGDWKGTFQIRTPEESFLITQQNGKFQVKDGDSSCQVTLNHPALTQWVLGRKLFSELPLFFEEVKFQDLSLIDMNQMDLALPKTEWLYWYTDSY